MPFDNFFSSQYKKVVHHENDDAWNEFRKLTRREQNNRIDVIRHKPLKERSSEECSIICRFFIYKTAFRRVSNYERHKFYTSGDFAKANKHCNPIGTHNTCSLQTKKPFRS